MINWNEELSRLREQERIAAQQRERTAQQRQADLKAVKDRNRQLLIQAMDWLGARSFLEGLRQQVYDNAGAVDPEYKLWGIDFTMISLSYRRPSIGKRETWDQDSETRTKFNYRTVEVREEKELAIYQWKRDNLLYTPFQTQVWIEAQTTQPSYGGLVRGSERQSIPRDVTHDRTGTLELLKQDMLGFIR